MSSRAFLVREQATHAALDDRPLGPVFEAAFDVLDLPVHLLVVRGTPDLLDEGRARVTELLHLWLGPDSELDRVAASEGRAVLVSPETLLLADVAQRPDPDGVARTDRRSPTRTLVSSGGGPVNLPAAILPDVAALAGALAADLVARELIDGGALGACARVGDDAALLGVPPRMDGWRVEVPDGFGRTSHLLLEEGGVSSRGRWSGTRAATVTAPTAWQAARRALHAVAKVPAIPAPR
jgi:hypothetical protein